MINQIQEIFREVFKDPQLEITRKTTASNVSAWDSLNNIKILISIEQKFGFKFSSSDVSGLKDVGELIDRVEQLLIEVK